MRESKYEIWHKRELLYVHAQFTFLISFSVATYVHHMHIRSSKVWYDTHFSNLEVICHLAIYRES